MTSKTSIILCTYNEAKYIENTISELEKSISNLELVIVDDNSSDGTVEIIKKFCFFGMVFLMVKINIKLA